MPLYEYQCDECGHRFEVIQKYSDPPIDKCPVCGKTVHKLQSAPAFQFKGSGWYVTDYARKDGAKPATDGASGEGNKEKVEKTEKPGKAASTEKTGAPAATKASDASSSATTSGKQS
jgi:putative FmdB family regulatory protein